MPRTITFIAAVAAALAVAVPTASAEGQPAGTHSAELASVTAVTFDPRQGSFEVKRLAMPAPDWSERLAAAHSIRNPVADDRFRIDPTGTAMPVAASSGREVEWQQIGVGLAFGLLLGLGLVLAVRMTDVRRPVAR
jgi:hypothetical protein